MIEVCLVVYHRAHRLPKIMGELKAQTRQDFNLNIWNNSGIALKIDNFPKERLRIYETIDLRNLGSQVRFRLAKETQGNPIIFFDDDESLESDFVDYYYKQYIRTQGNAILGWHVKRWESNDFKQDIYGGDAGTEVDYVGTGGMILDRKIIDEEKSLLNIPEGLDKVEDLYLSYIAREKYNLDLVKIEAKCKIINDNLNQYTRLRAYKAKAFKTLMDKGWRLIYKNL